MGSVGSRAVYNIRLRWAPGPLEIIARAGSAIDIMFNCAGYVDAGALEETQEAGYALSFDLNVHAIT